jgi:hypothetical protein
MVNDFNLNTKNKEEWYTPPFITDSLGPFDLDVCNNVDSPFVIANANFYKEDGDGLSKHWFGRVWCNPPYGRKTFEWLNKLAEHGNGIALIFARTETIGFHKQIWNKANAIFFFKGRLKFYHKSGIQGDVANAPSCLIAYGIDNVVSLEVCGLPGKLVKLRD